MQGNNIDKMSNKNKNGAGKGDSYRPVNQKRWDENWERIFGKGNRKDKDNNPNPNNGNKDNKDEVCSICDGAGVIQEGGTLSPFVKCDCRRAKK